MINSLSPVIPAMSVSQETIAQPTGLKTSTFTLPINGYVITIQHFTANDVIDNFINALDKDELKTLCIAYEHLGSSFDLERSIIFTKWQAGQVVMSTPAVT